MDLTSYCDSTGSDAHQELDRGDSGGTREAEFAREPGFQAISRCRTEYSTETRRERVPTHGLLEQEYQWQTKQNNTCTFIAACAGRHSRLSGIFDLAGYYSGCTDI